MTNDDAIQTRWAQVRDRIRSRWSKFSDAEIDSMRGNLDRLSVLLRKVYGYAEGRTEREYHEFRVSLRPVLQERPAHESKNLHR